MNRILGSIFLAMAYPVGVVVAFMYDMTLVTLLIGFTLGGNAAFALVEWAERRHKKEEA